MSEPTGIVGGLILVFSWLAGLGGSGPALHAPIATPAASRAASAIVLTGLAQPQAQPESQPARPQPAPTQAAPAQSNDAKPAAERSASDVAWLLVKEEGQFKPEEYAGVEEILRKAVQAEPGNWLYKSALAALLTNRREHEPAIKLAEEACVLAPTEARAWYWKGQCHFNHLSQTRSLSAVGEIDDARNAMLKAIELDAAYLSPRMAVSMFYIEAPGIVGGSIRKAREQGQAMLALGKQGQFLGHMVLARCAAYKEEWEDARTHYQQMEAAADSVESRCSAVIALARMQLDKQEAYADALASAKRALEMAPHASAKASALFLIAESQRKLKDLPAAIESYRAVLAVNPDAPRSRWALAECLEQARKYAEAAEQYEGYASRFPADEKAQDATSKARKLRKKAG